MLPSLLLIIPIYQLVLPLLHSLPQEALIDLIIRSQYTLSIGLPHSLYNHTPFSYTYLA